MPDYFKKYKQSKYVLLSLIKDNFAKSCSFETADNCNLKYEQIDVLCNNINVYYHDYDSLALLTWDVLGIKNPVITDYQIRELEKQIRNEKYFSSINYYKIYLKNYLLISKYVLKYYTYDMNVRRANELGITYRNSDIENEHLMLCDHYDSKIGIKVWKFLGIDRPDIPKSAVVEKSEGAKKKLLELENIQIN